MEDESPPCAWVRRWLRLEPEPALSLPQCSLLQMSHCLARLLWTDFGTFEAELWGECQPSLCMSVQPHILETSAGHPSMRSSVFCSGSCVNAPCASPVCSSFARCSLSTPWQIYQFTPGSDSQKETIEPLCYHNSPRSAQLENGRFCVSTQNAVFVTTRGWNSKLLCPTLSRRRGCREPSVCLAEQGWTHTGPNLQMAALTLLMTDCPHTSRCCPSPDRHCSSSSLIMNDCSQEKESLTRLLIWHCSRKSSLENQWPMKLEVPSEDLPWLEGKTGHIRRAFSPSSFPTWASHKQCKHSHMWEWSYVNIGENAGPDKLCTLTL